MELDAEQNIGQKSRWSWGIGFITFLLLLVSWCGPWKASATPRAAWSMICKPWTDHNGMIIRGLKTWWPEFGFSGSQASTFSAPFSDFYFPCNLRLPLLEPFCHLVTSAWRPETRKEQRRIGLAWPYSVDSSLNFLPLPSNPLQIRVCWERQHFLSDLSTRLLLFNTLRAEEVFSLLNTWSHFCLQITSRENDIWAGLVQEKGTEEWKDSLGKMNIKCKSLELNEPVHCSRSRRWEQGPEWWRVLYPCSEVWSLSWRP